MALLIIVCVLWGFILGFASGMVYATYTDYVDISNIH